MRHSFTTITRRTVLKLTAIALLVAGLTLLAVALVPTPASASINSQSLTVSDGYYQADGADVRRAGGLASVPISGGKAGIV